jgi:hypothetical protein
MKSSRLLIASLACLLVVMGWCVQARAQAQWTVMVYMVADNNLELAGINDFLEIAQVGSDNNLNIIVQFDRAVGYDTSYGDWTTCKRFRITQGMTPTAENALMDLGEVNMGDPNTLIDFINWATAAYPAQRYALVIWNHGDGWKKLQSLYQALPLANTVVQKEAIQRQIIELQTVGEKAVGPDEGNNNDVLTTAELKSALNAVAVKPHYLGFDACLEGMLEVAYAVKDTGSEVMVASEETEYLAGWPWNTVLAGLKANPSWTPAQFASWTVDKYYEAALPANALTMAAVYLNQISILASRVSDLANALIYHWDDDQNVGKAAAQAVKNQMAATVFTEKHGTGYPGAHGLSIYFPRLSSELDKYNYSKTDFAAGTEWYIFLLYYCQTLSQSGTGNWVTDARTQSQQFDDQTYVDLYDFCDKLQQSYLTLWEALDCPLLSWSTGGTGDLPGFIGQKTTFLIGGDAAQSLDIVDNQNVWLRATVTGPGRVYFYWKVSSEANFDWLEFYIDGVLQNRISGEVDWNLQTFTTPAGQHTLEWRYSKDGSISHGYDCSWVDGVLYSIDFNTALDNSDLTFSSGGYAGWVGQDRTYLLGGSAAQNQPIPDGQNSWLQTSVTGPGTLSFHWKVSSEANFDFLAIYLDDNWLSAISGDVWKWTYKEITIPTGAHTVQWRYQKDGSVSKGEDCGWVDYVRFLPLAITSLQEALDNYALTFASGGNTSWFGQGLTYYYGTSAAQSGTIGNSQKSYFETTVTGPGNLSFYWKVSSEGSFDFLRFLVNGAIQDGISGEVGWTKKSIILPAGNHLLRWEYAKDSSNIGGDDHGWVDKVVYIRRVGAIPCLGLLLD